MNRGVHLTCVEWRGGYKYHPNYVCTMNIPIVVPGDVNDSGLPLWTRYHDNMKCNADSLWKTPRMSNFLLLKTMGERSPLQMTSLENMLVQRERRAFFK